MDTKQAGCMICGTELVYKTKNEDLICFICGQKKSANAECGKGHFVCDSCHKSNAEDVITALCRQYKGTNPIKLAMEIMDSSVIKMHGPEHHYLVPAVLLTTFYNAQNKPELIAEKLTVARKRSKIIPGGFCGFYGNCGAGVGTGIFMSIATNATPLSSHEWKLSNLMTAGSLKMIAESGGPRCCKRDTFIAINEAVHFTSENLHVKMEKDENVRCHYFNNNKQCLASECQFYTK
jgi:hypothetical protein